jgi:hypothetical protein
VRYRYRVYEHREDVAVVTQTCRRKLGAGAPGLAFVKERSSMAVNGGSGTRGDLQRPGTLATNSVAVPNCAWLGAIGKSTGQCDGDSRVRARELIAAPASEGRRQLRRGEQALPQCRDARRGVSGGDVVPGSPSTFWEKGGQGLDQWAVVAAARQAANTTDSAAGGAQWACHGGSPGDAQQRRWEIAGGPKNAQGQYQGATVMFHAWEGGTGAYDCEPLLRRFGPDGESFGVHAEYSINDGWGFQ